MRRAALRGVLIWALLLGFWLLLVGGTAPPEVLAGAAAATIATAAAIAAERATGARFHLRSRWLLELRHLPRLVAADTVLAGGELVRSVLGRPSRSRYAVLGPLPVTGASPRAAAGRAVYTILGSLPPGTIVVGFDEETGRILLHQLVARPADLGMEFR